MLYPASCVVTSGELDLLLEEGGGGCLTPPRIRPPPGGPFRRHAAAPAIPSRPADTCCVRPEAELTRLSGMYPYIENNFYYIKARIETNPGREEATKYFKLAHANISSITVGQKRDELELFLESNGITVLALS